MFEGEMFPTSEHAYQAGQSEEARGKRLVDERPVAGSTGDGGAWSLLLGCVVGLVCDEV